MSKRRAAQDQRSVTDQLLSVVGLAIKHGHYDAADWITRQAFAPLGLEWKDGVLKIAVSGDGGLQGLDS